MNRLDEQRREALEPNPILSVESNEPAPSSFSLYQNFPNPFNPITTVEFTLPTPEDVQIEVYDITGQKIKTLFNKSIAAGQHKVEFNAENLLSGVYFYRIEAGEIQDVKKMVLLR